MLIVSKLLVVKDLCDLFNHIFAGFSVFHFLNCGGGLEVDVLINEVPGGQEMGEVNELDERLDLRSLLNSALAHSL